MRKFVLPIMLVLAGCEKAYEQDAFVFECLENCSHNQIYIGDSEVVHLGTGSFPIDDCSTQDISCAASIVTFAVPNSIEMIDNCKEIECSIGNGLFLKTIESEGVVRKFLVKDETYFVETIVDLNPRGYISSLSVRQCVKTFSCSDAPYAFYVPKSKYRVSDIIERMLVLPD